jgi:hypothetical protein
MAQADSDNSTPAPATGPAANSIYLPTDISPEQLFLAIGKLRKDARDEIDRLLRFLDETDDHMEREPDDDEPSLGFLECFPGQGKGSGYGDLGDDREAENEHDEDGADGEASLGSLDQPDDQTKWGHRSPTDREGDPAESGIGDMDGLLEQTGRRDWQPGVIA